MPTEEELERQGQAVEKVTEQTKALKKEASETEKVFIEFTTNATRRLALAVIEGKNLQSVLRSLALELSRKLINEAAEAFGNSLGATFFRPSPKETISPPKRFAKGGVISGPSLFPLGQGLGLAGEAGPEAVLPLKRGADGRLGVESGRRSAQSITVNISTPDADSFLRSEAQVSRALARAVARGQKTL